MDQKQYLSYKRYVFPLLGTLFLYIWSLATKMYAFQTESETITELRTLYIPICFCALYYIQELWTKRNEKPVQMAIAAFLVYEILNGIILILIYPGAWRWDDVNVFNAFMANGQLNYWQHYLTIVFYIFALFVAPFPAGIVFVQFTIISIIFAYCVYVVARLRIWNQTKWRYLLLIPFFFIPTFDHNMWPLRLSLYCMLEVLLVVLILEPKVIDCADIWERPKRLMTLVVLTAILANWRTEGILYCFLVPALLFVIYPVKSKKMLRGGVLISCIVLTGTLYLPQRYGLSPNKDYDLTGVLRPISPLIQQAAEDEQTEILTEIDKVINIDTIMNGYENGTDGIQLYWNDRSQLIQNDFSDEDYNGFKLAYVKLVLRYPMIYMSERISTFLDSWKEESAGFIGWLYTSERPSLQVFSHSYHLNRPLSNTLRIKVGEILNAEGDGYNLTRWTFNYYAQTAAIIAFTLYLAISRSKYLFVALVMEVRMVLTFLTAPALIFMYYYNLWLFGNFIIFRFAAFLCYKIQEGIKERRTQNE